MASGNHRGVIPTILILVSLLFGASTICAAPEVLLIEGIWVEDSSITVYGDSFGFKGHAGPVLWDTVNNQDAYLERGLNEGDIIPVTDSGCADCPWETQTVYGNPVLYQESDPRVPGEHMYRINTKGYLKFPDQGGNETPVLYINWWCRSSGDISGNSNKLIRVWRNTTGDYRSSWTTMHMTRDQDDNHDGVEDGASAPSWANWQGHTNAWNHLEYICDGRGDIGHGYGTLTALTNQEVVHDVNYYSTEPFNYIDVVGLDSSDSDDTQGYRFDFTSVYIDTTMARVIVGDKSAYSDITHAEIQIPLTWSNDNITLDVNRGSLDIQQEHWLYVFDRYGNHNEIGYSLVPAIFPGRPGKPTH